MWDAGCKLPTQVASGRSQCYCGAEIDNKSIGPHIDAEHMTWTNTSSLVPTPAPKPRRASCWVLSRLAPDTRRV